MYGQVSRVTSNVQVIPAREGGWQGQWHELPLPPFFCRGVGAAGLVHVLGPRLGPLVVPLVTSALCQHVMFMKVLAGMGHAPLLIGVHPSYLSLTGLCASCPVQLLLSLCL